MSTLVTGGAGFVGASLVRALEQRGEAVRVADSGIAAGFRYLAGTRAEIVEVELTGASASDLDGLMVGVDAVVHLCARTGVPASILDPWGDFEHNTALTVRLLEAARARNVARFVAASSNAAVGRQEGPAREDAAAAPVTPYGASKLAMEAYLHAYHESYGMTTTALRFANAYGPFALHKQSVVATYLRTLLAGDPLTVFGDGSQTRDFVHVDDLVAAILAVLDAAPSVVGGVVFQVGTGRETTVLELARALIALHGSGRLEHRPLRAGEVGRNVSAIDRARTRLGYEPRVELQAGLARTLAWFRDALRDPALAPLADAPRTSGSE